MYSWQKENTKREKMLFRDKNFSEEYMPVLTEVPAIHSKVLPEGFMEGTLACRKKI